MPPLITPDGKPNVFHAIKDGQYQFYQATDKGWCKCWSKVGPNSVLKTEAGIYNAAKGTEAEIAPPFWMSHSVLENSQEVYSRKPVFDFGKIPRKVYLQLVSFYEDYAFSLHNKNLEVGTLVVFNETTKELNLLVVKQTVSAVRVDMKGLLESECSSLDGAESKPLKDWLVNHLFIGYCHSHNTMTLSTPSITDDGTEKPLDGLHILLSCFKQRKDNVVPEFKIYCSYTLHGKRYELPAEEVFSDLSEIPEEAYVENLFNSEVCKLVTVAKPVVYSKYTGTSSTSTVKALLPVKSGKKTKKGQVKKGFDWKTFYANKYAGFNSASSATSIIGCNTEDLDSSGFPMNLTSALDSWLRFVLMNNKDVEIACIEQAVLDILTNVDWEEEIQMSLRIQQKAIESTLESFELS